MPSLIYSGFTEGANCLTSATYSGGSVVPVSYRENIRVGRWEIFEYFFHGFGGFLLGDFQ